MSGGTRADQGVSLELFSGMVIAGAGSAAAMTRREPGCRR